MYKTEITDKLIGLTGGHDSCWFEIVDLHEAEVVNYPAIVNGKEVPYHEFKTIEEYFRHKQKVTYRGAVLTIAGNGVCAEAALQDMGYRAINGAPHSVEIMLERVLQS